MRARWLAWGMGLLALAASGFYVFIYLYRWEWNRALMAGVLFVAAEIALATALVLDRFKALERKLDDRTSATPGLHSLDAIEDAAPAPRRHFAWLTDQDKVGVFVPVLMGAGIVISGIAWAVERLAASTARPLLERRLALKLEPLALPAGGLTGSGPARSALPARSARATLKRIFAILCVGAALAVSIDVLGDLTQNRPDATTAGQTTVALELTIRDEDLGSAKQAARSLWEACRVLVSNDLAGMVATGSTVSMTFEPAIGPYSMQRLQGCFEDGTLDGLSAEVVQGS